MSLYDLGETTTFRNAADAALASHYATTVRDALRTFYTPGVNTCFVDVLDLLQDVQANPGAYGFLHATSADSCAASSCTSQPLSVQNTYVFNDSIHFTGAFRR